MSSSRRAQWDIEGYGWSAVPRNRSNVPNAEEVNEIPADDIEDYQDALAMANEINVEDVWPITALTEKARAYAKQELSTETFNHSLRVHAYGYYMITRHFGNWIGSTFFETWALTCLFHDIGTTPKNMADTHLSFEFQGGMIALTKLLEFGAPKIQAESVMEAIIRHQDPGETGMISAMGQMIQLATEFDNMGWQPHLVPEVVIERVTSQLPRLGWSGCFSKQIEKEIEQKPWCHTTAIPNFKEAVAGNVLMQPFE